MNETNELNTSELNDNLEDSLLHLKWLSHRGRVKVVSMIELFFLLVMSDSISLRFFELFEKYGGYKSGKLKLKKPKQLQVGLF